jgi:hypothetical protein
MKENINVKTKGTVLMENFAADWLSEILKDKN